MPRCRVGENREGGLRRKELGWQGQSLQMTEQLHVLPPEPYACLGLAQTHLLSLGRTQAFLAKASRQKWSGAHLLGSPLWLLLFLGASRLQQSYQRGQGAECLAWVCLSLRQPPAPGDM